MNVIRSSAEHKFIQVPVCTSWAAPGLTFKPSYSSVQSNQQVSGGLSAAYFQYKRKMEKTNVVKRSFHEVQIFGENALFNALRAEPSKHSVSLTLFLRRGRRRRLLGARCWPNAPRSVLDAHRGCRLHFTRSFQFALRSETRSFRWSWNFPDKDTVVVNDLPLHLDSSLSLWRAAAGIAWFDWDGESPRELKCARCGFKMRLSGGFSR